MEQAQVERRLAAILSADVKGYSSLMAEDETGTVRSLNACREVIGALVHHHRGRVVDQPGDNLLAEFPSAVEAVMCGIETQHALRARNADLPPNRRMEFRIGIHLGEVMVEGERIYGDGVNIAARLERLSAPGGMCVSERVYEDISNKLSIEAKYLGEKSLKNVPRPVRAWALASSESGTSSAMATRIFRAVPSTWSARLIIAAALLSVVLGSYFYAPVRTEIGAAMMVYVPRLMPKQFERKIDFCTTSDGVRIAYGTTGHGPPVVFVISWMTHLERGFSSGTYGSIPVEMLGESHTIVEYDGRGFGMSDRGFKDYSAEARVRDIEAVVDALALKRFAIWGVSAGGPPAIAYAARHQDRLTRLVLDRTFAKYDLTLLNPEERERLQAVLALVTKGWSNPAFQDLFSSLLWPDGTEAGKRFFKEMERISATPEDAAALLRQGTSVDETSAAAQIRVPTLIVHVRGDQIVPLEFGKQLGDLVPGGRLVIVEGRNHMGVPGSPEFEQISHAVRPFLDEDLSSSR